MTMPKFRIAVIGGLCLMSVNAFAHHSFVSEFDRDLPFLILGAVQSVEWTNPHGRLHVDVEEAGEIVTYDFELPSPNTLIRQGWSRHELKPGDRIRVSGHRSRTVWTIGRASGISRESGEPVFGGGVSENPEPGPD